MPDLPPDSASSTPPDLTPRIRAALEHFSERLLRANEVMNLTACKDHDTLWTRHVLDSLTLSPHLPRGVSIADVGSGGGFPAIPLAIAREDVRVTLIEATGKKCAFLQSVIEEMNLRNARVVNSRSEALAHERDHREAYDFCVARALSAMRVLVELTLPFVRPGGSLLAMKGANVAAELGAANRALSVLGGGAPVIHRCPGDPSGACIVVVRKLRPTPGLYPRPPGKPAVEPL